MLSGSNSAKNRNAKARRDGNGSGNARASDESTSPESANKLSRIQGNPIDWEFFLSLNLPGENAIFSLHDGTSRFLETTPGCEKTWGKSPNQLKGETLAGITENGADLKDWLFNVNRQSREQTYRVDLVKSENGSARALSLKAIPLFISKDPEETRVVVKAVPVAKPVCNERAFPANFNLSSIHCFDGGFESVNASWAELFDQPIEQFKELSLFDIIHPSDKDALSDFLLRARDEDSVISCILRFRSNGGRVKTLLFSARRDIHNTKLIVEAKNMTVEGDNLAMELLKTSVELVKESVMLLMRVGPNFRICFANRAFEDMTGYRYSRIAGSSLACLNGPKTNTKAILDIEEALQKEAEHTSNLLLYCKDREAFWANMYLIPLRDNTGVANHFAAIIEDTTEVRNVSDELARKNEELQDALKNLKETQKTIVQQESLRALGEMASGIAHDFNNLLAPILGFSELLLTVPDAASDEKRLRSYLKKIQVAAQDGAAVVSRLREFYRSQNSPEEFITIQPEELLWQVKELTRHRWKTQAEAKGLNITFKMDIGSGRSIMGNEPELRQVFTNLIINAVDAMKRDGSITVTISDNDEQIRIVISDTGCGMNKETRQKCLEPFYTTKGKLGTGLGLSIVFGVVQRHHGEFNIESKEGKGTSIIMDFPANDNKAEEEIDHDLTTTRSLRIMLVDDEEVLLEVVSELLASGGHTVDIHSNPTEAIDAIKQKEYDLVITDRAMPLMSGDQLAAAVKEHSPATPIFMITGFGDLIKDSGEIPENVDEVLAKPVPLDVLNRKLAEIAASR